MSCRCTEDCDRDDQHPRRLIGRDRHLDQSGASDVGHPGPDSPPYPARYVVRSRCYRTGNQLLDTCLWQIKQGKDMMRCLTPGWAESIVKTTTCRSKWHYLSERKPYKCASTWRKKRKLTRVYKADHGNGGTVATVAYCI